MAYSFYALLSRMKHIRRWGLMRSARPENLAEHTLEVVYIAHALALYAGADVSRTVLCAMYHDCSEIITGDLPTPIKYANDALKSSYKALESDAQDRLLHTLPESLRPQLAYAFGESDPVILALVKAADKLSALIKCTEELSMGNLDFQQAALAQRQALSAMDLPCVQWFMDNFLPAYNLTLDELQQPFPTAPITALETSADPGV